MEESPLDTEDTARLHASSRPGWIDNAVARLARLGADPEDDEELRQRKSLLVLLAVLILPVSVVWGSVYLAFGSPLGSSRSSTSPSRSARWCSSRGPGSFRLLLVIQLLDVLLMTTVGQMLSGGFLPSGGVGLWGILAPLGALVFLEVRQAVRWFGAFVVVFLATGIAGEVFFRDADLPVAFTSTMLALNIVGTGAVAFTSSPHSRTSAMRRWRHSGSSSRSPSSLLVNILPRSIAERLKADNGTIADHFDSASILFADIVDFTPLARGSRRPRSSRVLDQLFSTSTRSSSGTGSRRSRRSAIATWPLRACRTEPGSRARAALLALDMRDGSRLAVDDGVGLELRIGINSGPVIAGVIGTKRFLYDLWGDAVNTASRMESHSTSGEIQITRATYELLKDEFVCTLRGTIEVKGKGQMETWYLVGARPDGWQREARGMRHDHLGSSTRAEPASGP